MGCESQPMVVMKIRGQREYVYRNKHFPAFTSQRVTRSFLQSNSVIRYPVARMGILCEEAARNHNAENTPDAIQS